MWDSFHTFIRPIGAAILAATAVGSVDPKLQVTAAVLSGGVALSTHTSKAGTRFLVNHSPEPFSNIGLSLGEDLFAFGGTWLALAHPIVMLAIVIVCVGVFVWLFRKLYRAFRSRWNSVFHRKRVDAVRPGTAA